MWHSASALTFEQRLDELGEDAADLKLLLADAVNQGPFASENKELQLFVERMIRQRAQELEEDA